MKVRAIWTPLVLLLLVSCAKPRPGTVQASAVEPAGEPGKRIIRITGLVEAVHSSKVVVPQLSGNNNRMTLTRIIASGVHVKEGDVVATFDATAQLDARRDAQAKYDDLGHQADQKRAQNTADAEGRASTLMQAQGDLSKAEIELTKGPVLSDIGRVTNEEKARIARLHVASLKKSNGLHDQADVAALRILELQRDRQKVAIERAEDNIRKLEVRAPLAGMASQEIVYRSNNMGHPQEGDQLYRGQPIVSIFDPGQMLVRCTVGEPDIAAIAPGTRARVSFDAYPDLVLAGHFENASPVATSSVGSPIRTFYAVFRIDQTDAHLLPDLSAAVVIDLDAAARAGGGSK